MKRPRVIIADDYEDTLELWRVDFKGAAFDAEFVADGGTLRERAVGEEFDLIITDLAMSPVDGWSAIESIRAADESVPIWAVSAYSERDMMNRMRARSLGVQLMAKDDVVHRLRELIERFLGVPAETRAGRLAGRVTP